MFSIDYQQTHLYPLMYSGLGTTSRYSTRRHPFIMFEIASVAITTVLSVLVLVDIVGNSLVCAIIKRNREMRYVEKKMLPTMLTEILTILLIKRVSQTLLRNWRHQTKIITNIRRWRKFKNWRGWEHSEKIKVLYETTRGLITWTYFECSAALENIQRSGWQF